MSGRRPRRGGEAGGGRRLRGGGRREAAVRPAGGLAATSSRGHRGDGRPRWGASACGRCAAGFYSNIQPTFSEGVLRRPRTRWGIDRCRLRVAAYGGRTQSLSHKSAGAGNSEEATVKSGEP